MNDLISVILPVYNGERFLAQSIESVIAQKYDNWELVILDDCSTDATPNIIQKYAKEDKRIKYYRNEQNLKLPGNLNKGFSIAKGSYLTWTSDDNKYRDNALEKMYNVISENKDIDLVYASYQVIDENDMPIQVIEADKNGKEHITGTNVVGACFLYSRKAYENTGEYNKELYLVEDFDYWQRMMSKYNSIAITDVLYDYRLHDKSLTSTKNEKVFGERLEKMLLKNKNGFGNCSMEANYYFYNCLKQSYEAQSKKNKFIVKYSLYSVVHRVKRLINR